MVLLLVQFVVLHLLFLLLLLLVSQGLPPGGFLKVFSASVVLDSSVGSAPNRSDGVRIAEFLEGAPPALQRFLWGPRWDRCPS